MKIYLIYTVLIVILVWSAFVSYSNLELKRELKQSEFYLQGDHKNHLTADGIEGKLVGKYLMNDISGNSINMHDLIKKNNYSIIIAEPIGACSSCLNVTLHNWLAIKDSVKNVNIPKLIIISSKEWRKSWIIAKDYGLQDVCLVDKEGKFYSDFLGFSTASASLFINRNGKIIYFEYVSWKTPENFIMFVQKCVRFINN